MMVDVERKLINAIQPVRVNNPATKSELVVPNLSGITGNRDAVTKLDDKYVSATAADSAVGPLTITADNSSADTAYVPMVLYNTDATPPAANTVPIGTIYIQYTP